MAREGQFLEWADVFGNYYGTSAADTEAVLARGEDVVLVIDVQGARQVRSRGIETIGIFVLPPSAAVLEQRLRGRSKDSEEQIRDGSRWRARKSTNTRVTSTSSSTTRSTRRSVACNQSWEPSARALDACVRRGRHHRNVSFMKSTPKRTGSSSWSLPARAHQLLRGRNRAKRREEGDDRAA